MTYVCTLQVDTRIITFVEGVAENVAPTIYIWEQIAHDISA